MEVNYSQSAPLDIKYIFWLCCLPAGSSFCHGILRQKLPLDGGSDLGLQSGGLGRHAAAVSPSDSK